LISDEDLWLVCFNHDLGFEKCNDEEMVVLDPFENHNETSKIQVATVLFDNVQGGENFFSDKDSREDEQLVVFPFENYQFEIIEQEAILEAICPFVFSDQQENIFYNFKDPMVNMLEFLVKVEFVLFMNTGTSFNYYSEFSCLKFMFMLEEIRCMLRSRIQLFDWLHWHFCIT